MSTLTADPKLQSYLLPLKEPTEIRSPDGQVLGYFTPAEQEAAKSIRDLFDPVELKRRKALNQKGYSIDEVRSHLAELEARQGEQKQ